MRCARGPCKDLILIFREHRLGFHQLSLQGARGRRVRLYNRHSSTTNGDGLENHLAWMKLKLVFLIDDRRGQGFVLIAAILYSYGSTMVIVRLRMLGCCRMRLLLLRGVDVLAEMGAGLALRDRAGIRCGYVRLPRAIMWVRVNYTDWILDALIVDPFQWLNSCNGWWSCADNRVVSSLWPGSNILRLLSLFNWRYFIILVEVGPRSYRLCLANHVLFRIDELGWELLLP